MLRHCRYVGGRPIPHYLSIDLSIYLSACVCVCVCVCVYVCPSIHLCLSDTLLSLQNWFNPFLQWNASDYGGIQHMMVDAGKVWVPDILLYNK